jgi:hypothetical protein
VRRRRWDVKPRTNVRRTGGKAGKIGRITRGRKTLFDFPKLSTEYLAIAESPLPPGAESF